MRLTLLLLITAITGGCTASTGGSATTTSSEAHRINGTSVLRDTYVNLDAIDPNDLLAPDREWKNDDACSGDGGYQDVESGLGVSCQGRGQYRDRDWLARRGGNHR